ncbi:MnhB domain-containing protein [Geomonas agri]|uniref:MnhB domain-containing protein n=1 Tax=Geomonas agri TaxID=2873702 RepID=UPI001CD2CEAD|nr:MnhB domain-containing protein [Geomonas agri]
MSGKRRHLPFFLGALLFGASLLRALDALPPFGDYRGTYGPAILVTMEPLRHVQQAVASVTFDYRGFDTLGEEFILFAAVAGCLLLLRRQESEVAQEPVDQTSDRQWIQPAPAVLGLGVLMFPFTLLLGIYIVLHGHLTPGGGFQGGVLLATAFYYVYLSGEYDDLLGMSRDHTVSHLEAGGAAGYVIIGLLALPAGYRYLHNLLPLGDKGELLSAGTLPLLNITVGTEVTSAFLLLIVAFLRQVLVIRKEKKP